MAECYVCGRHTNKRIMKRDEYQILECKCGLAFIEPLPDSQEVMRLYSTEYFDNWYPYAANKPFHTKYFEKKLEQISSHKPQGNLLDVGCGLGFFLALAREAGWKTYGVDLSVFAVRHAREKLGLNVFAGALEDINFPDNEFDVVTLFQVIEHVGDPAGLMREVHRVLKPTGVAVLVTPNRSSISAKVLGKRWFGYRHREHLFFFTLASVRLLLQKTSFGVIECRADELRALPLEYILRRLIDYYPHSAVRLGSWFLRATVGKVLQTVITEPMGDIYAVAVKSSVASQ